MPAEAVAQIRDITPGLWVWSRPHPEWTPDSDFDGPVTSTCVEAGGEVVVLDPLAPEAEDAEAWAPSPGAADRWWRSR